MKLHRIAVSIAALCAGGIGLSAQAAGIERLAGASASSVNVAKALRTLCAGASGTFALYKTSSSTSSLGNIVTMTCSVPFSGSTDQVRVDVAGGSLGAVTAATAGGATAVAFINPAAATCSALGAGTESLSFIPAGEMQNCGSTGQVQETSDGGFLDVEGSVFRANGLAIPASVDDSTDYVASNFYQAFGVGASTSLYQMLQSYQVYKGQLPASCATTAVSGGVTTYTGTNDTTPTCQPSISRAQLTSLFNSGSNVIKTAGVNGLIGGTTSVASDLPASVAIVPSPALKTKITYCRRPATSGTQASTQLYFLANPTAKGDLGGFLGVFGSATAPATVNLGTTYTASTNSGTGDVKTCLNAAGYAVGTLSLENNPIGGSDTFRFVKLNGDWGSEGVAGASQSAEAIAGRYDFVFQSYMYCPGGTCSPILNAINTALPAGSSSPGLYLLSESNFKKDKATGPLKAK